MKTIIVTLTAPSGTGKSHLEAELVKSGFAKLISHTTRQRRAGEVDGVDYHFVDREFWDDGGPWVEEVEFAGNRYGVSSIALHEVAQAGKPVVVVVEPHGMLAFADYAKQRPDIELISVFLDIDEETRLVRFFKRAAAEVNEKGTNAVVSLTIRLNKILNEERTWTSDCISGRIHYDMVLGYTVGGAYGARDNILRRVLRTADHLVMRSRLETVAN